MAVVGYIISQEYNSLPSTLSLQYFLHNELLSVSWSVRNTCIIDEITHIKQSYLLAFVSSQCLELKSFLSRNFRI
jgi:hypothetical protein